MNIEIPAFNAADALSHNYKNIRSSAVKIASKESMQGDSSKENEIVMMRQSELQFSAVAKAVKAESDLMGFLLDEKV